MAKRDGRRLLHEVLETYRFATVRLYQSGVDIGTIRKSLGVARETVYAWLRRARDGGMEALKAKKAPGPAPKLKEQQFEQLKEILRKPATEMGYATELWSAPRIKHLVKYQFGIVYNRTHMPRLLKRIGLCLKFPERRALEQDPQAVRQWKKYRLPKIMKYARKKRAIVFYADESLISLIPYVGRTWTFPEAKPTVRVSGKRGQQVGITAAVNEGGRLCFELTKEGEKFTAKVFIRFVTKLRREHPRRGIILIVDGAPTHRAKLVRTFQKQNLAWLSLEILPAYSPELNPTEKSWRFVKTKKLDAFPASTKNELKAKVRSTMHGLKADSKKITSFFSA